MLPRLRPPFLLGDLLQLASAEDEERFESAFAARFGFPYGLFFPYGRSALHALLEAAGWRDQEIAVPGYTCAVVPHAVVLSGNRVRFIDCARDHFNVPPANLKDALGAGTKVVIPTPLFGYPLQRQEDEAVIADRAPRAFVLLDTAHGFGVEDERGSQLQSADGALFGLGIGKLLTSLYGGMLLLRDESLFRELAAYRERSYVGAGRRLGAASWLYGVAIWLAFREPGFSLVHRLEYGTSWLDRFTQYYYGTDGIALPADFQTRPTALQARVGLAGLARYDVIVKARRRLAERYRRRLAHAGFGLFAAEFPPTYSHFPLLVGEREGVIRALRRRGIQLGRLIDYACPDLPGYEAYEPCPNASFFAARMVNLPIWFGLREKDVDRVFDALVRARDEAPDLFTVER